MMDSRRGTSSAPDPEADGRKRRVSGPERRRQILASAQETFLEMGFGAARVKDIAARVGIGEAVLYRHFSSKEEIFEAAVLQPLEELVEEMVGNAEVVADLAAEDVLGVGYLLHEHRMSVMVNIAPLWMVAILADNPGEESFYTQRIAPLIDRWAEALTPYLPAMSSQESARAVGLALLGMYAWIGLDALARGIDPARELDMKSIAHDIASLLHRGAGLPDFDRPGPPARPEADHPPPASRTKARAKKPG
jgi:AcrR family transcriptional regulator